MSDRDFDGPDLVAGSVIGVRSWKVDRLGRLNAVSNRHVWRPGENVAACAYGSGHGKPGGAGCSCGYWAYFDGRSSHDSYLQGEVTGLIEGYGRVTVGTLGFRTEKAKIIAFIAQRRRFHPWAAIGLALALLIAVTVTSLGLFVDPSLFALMPTVLAGVAIGTGGLIGTDASYVFGGGSQVTELVRRNYPDVPVFRSKAAALRRFPTIRPDIPVPSPDDSDFWTRSVS